MEVLYPRCAGLDIHAATVVACVRLASGVGVTFVNRVKRRLPIRKQDTDGTSRRQSNS
jgi:hypothetical protein